MGNRVYLLGFRGAGKTTLGRLLAEDLRASFVDLDERFEAAHGMRTPDWIAAHGEPAFRAEEGRLLAAVEAEAAAAPENTVIAPGGGIVEGEASRALLLASPAAKVWLDVPAEAIWARLAEDPARLKVGNLQGLKELQALLARRRPHFEKISTDRVENCDIKASLAKIKRVLEVRWR